MTCPKCRRETQEILSEGVPIDFCTGCRGTFLDVGEHAPFAGYPDAFQKAVEAGVRDPRPADFACPRCAGRMRTGWVLARDFEIERCDGCGGLWFDSRELSRLKKLEPQPEPTKPSTRAASPRSAPPVIPAAPSPPEVTASGPSPSAFSPELPVCPKCKQPPRESDQWQCRCNWRWHAISTRGVCPRCKRTWEELQCLRCAAWAPPKKWYDPTAN